MSGDILSGLGMGAGLDVDRGGKARLEPRTGLPEHLLPLWEELRPAVDPSIGAAGLEALCGQVHRLRQAQERISDEGIVTLDARGNPVPHPALLIERSAQAEVRNWMLKFGRR